MASELSQPSSPVVVAGGTGARLGVHGAHHRRSADAVRHRASNARHGWFSQHAGYPGAKFALAPGEREPEFRNVGEYDGIPTFH
ncbi:hypothetical protein HOK021_38020 [Streptomyces hygroscopicus]|nr:hypothetical protein HOK021_38020 [Streptomyces hygroscopicus]